MKILEITKEKQEASKKLVKETAKKAFPGEKNFTVVYAFLLRGLFIKSTASNFIIGFNTERKELSLAQFNKSGDLIGDSIDLCKDSIISIKTYKSGVVKISNTETEKPIKVTVPAVLPDVAELYDELPIEQTDEARAFYAFIKAFPGPTKQDGK